MAIIVDGKIAIVTGGSSGIGLAFVKLLQSKGCSVVIGDIQFTPDAEALQNNKLAKVLFKKTDVTNWKELTDLFTFTEKEIGVPDIVCPSAGIFEPSWSNFWNDTESQSYKTVQINVEHPVKATRLAIRSFIKAKKPGVVAHLSSIGGQTTRLNIPIYCATKSFLNHFVRAFSDLEAAENIKVIAIAPGMVATPLWFKENKERLKSVGETDLWIQPEEIATILYNVCVDPAYKGGTVIEASGQGQTRQVEIFNDPGPPGIGHKGGANSELEKDVYDLLQKEKSKL
ncbi:putative short chain dehydrogenase/ reductase [Tothia fuscella]|uniref:Short chain dehydrogenase/ reductase n=1 Tax=Tothia fuscella TaxID=1048955 RepID=A0A9P4NIT2_9PEZI|nr:putative short chain dehydrogenase/ reductase [Tothia fuscella]